MPPDFVALWLRAFAIAWPFAAVAAFIGIPIARWATARIIHVIGP